MIIGFFELFLLFLIVTVLFGPKLYPKIRRYQQMCVARNKRLQKVEAQRQAEAYARRQIRNTKIKIALVSVLAASLVFGGIYLAYWPTTVRVNAYAQADETAIDADLYASAQVLSAETLSVEGYTGLTQIRFYNDWIYAAAKGGKIIRIRENGTGLTELVATGGEILSLDFDAEDNIIFTDAAYDGAGGALLKASFDGFAVTVEPLVSSASGMSLAYPTGVSVAADGMIYFLNATEVSAAEQGGALQALRTAQVAHTQDGVLYAYNLVENTCEPMVTGLSFGAGLAVSATGEQLYLTQFTDSSLWAVDTTVRGATLGGEGTALLCAGMGGYPTGVSVNAEGELSVALLSPQMQWFESLCEKPALREVLLRLPKGTRNVLLTYQGAGLALRFDAEGQFIASYAAEGKRSMNMLTSAYQVGNRLYYAQAIGNEISYFANDF